MRRRTLCLLLPLALAAGCSTSSSVRVVSDAGSNSTAPADGSAFHWKADGNGVETGRFVVPMDYQDPSKGTFSLFVARHKATKPSRRIGTLLVNPGGPGFGGSDFALLAGQVYGKDLLERFDILGWDPRGTGHSTPAIDCISGAQYDHFYGEADITPDDDGERKQLVDLAKELADDCATRNAEILPYVGTNNSARDMNAIREALGEEKISYFGFSYGSELGATWATLFPGTVRAAVLDGAADPTADLTESSLQQAEGFERSLDTFLADCSKDRRCPFNNGGDAAAAFDALMERLDAHPLPANHGRPDLTRGAALVAVSQAMYDQSYWPQLEQALADAQDGNGAGLQDLYDEYFSRRPDGTYGNELEAFQTISCMDHTDRPTVAEDDASAPEIRKVAPRLSPGTTGSYMCTFWPLSIDPRVTITGKGAGPILVMGTTGDPATPLKSTERMATTLEDGRLVIVQGDQHTGYGVNDCSRSTVDRYLVDPVKNAPKSGTRCD